MKTCQKGCEEYNQLSRRQFLSNSAKVAAIATLPAWLPKIAFASHYSSNRDILVSIYLRGGADGLTLCAPHGDPAYYANRPTISVPRPDSGDPNRLTDLDGYFGFPRAMLPLLASYQAGELLVVHATGSIDSIRPATWPDSAIAAFMSPPK